MISSRYQAPKKGKHVEAETLEDEEPWDTVLDAFDNFTTQGSLETDSVLSKLLSKPNIQQLLPTVQSILASSRPNEAISEELAEIIGFEDIELVMDILTNREWLASQAREIIRAQPLAHCSLPFNQLSSSQAHDEIEPAMTNGKGKHKQKAHGAAKKDFSLSPEAVRMRVEEQLRANAERPLYTGVAV
ncbi:hypothetical protein JAAARDRAFT_241300 [Jaapia argillacea MUCL 33604]|uniref:Uncharacterized protein n=1 Tax=Jaapia argillacea MUCL 33604 TaxID=933084 RepID=A0A067QQE3_9AGAM|nr:hypothetical protein JAAARDRAFT_241300 [Jaapia argillacea MUCL 33604]